MVRKTHIKRRQEKSLVAYDRLDKRHKKNKLSIKSTNLNQALFNLQMGLYCILFLIIEHSIIHNK